MAQQFNLLPTFNMPLVINGVTAKEWYFFLAGLYQGLAPANIDPVSVTASPFIYEGPSRGFLLVTGGTVSLIEFSRDGVTFYNTGEISGQFTLSSADRLKITYSVLPTVTFVPT